MVDVLDLILISVGWIVASIATVAGVYLLHRYQEGSRRQQEDLVTILRPIHRELSNLLRYSGKIPQSFPFPILSEIIPNILDLGLLLPARHTELRADIDTLMRLHSKGASAFNIFKDAMNLGVQWDIDDARDKLQEPIAEYFSHLDSMSQRLDRAMREASSYA